MSTTEPPPPCHTCGHQPWGDDRFCAHCGESLRGESLRGESLRGESLHGESPASRVLPQFDLHDDDAAEPASPSRASRWETIIGLGILAVIIGVFAFIILAGDDGGSETVADEIDTDEVTEPDTEENRATATATPTSAATPTSLPTPTPRSTQTPTDVAVEPAGTGDDASTTRSLDELVEDYDLGTGWLTFVSGDGPTAVNLQTGERLVLTEFPERRGAASTAADFGGSQTIFLTAEGVWFNEQSAWTFFSWDGSLQREVAFDSSDFGLIALIDDPQVGALLYGATGLASDLSGVPQIETHSLELNERKVVELDELLKVNGRVVNDIFIGLLFEGRRQPVVTLSGQSYQWEWYEGWVEHSGGDVVATNTTGQVIELNCADPTRCAGAIIDNGDTLDDVVRSLPGFSAFGSGGNPVLGPSGRRVASHNDRSVEISDLTTGESQSFSVPVPAPLPIAPGANIAWSPNGSGLFVLGARSVYIDVASEQVVELDEQLGAPSGGLGLVEVFAELG